MIQPSARVYIQIRGKDPMTGAPTWEIIELDDFVTISTSLGITGESSATVELKNFNDKWYATRSKSARFQTDVADLLTKNYRTKRFRDINRELAYRYDEALKQGADVRDGALRVIANLEEYLVFDLMYRIWIDFRGRDDLMGLDGKEGKNVKERWYAGHTGLITGISNSFDSGRDHTLVINCKGPKRLFEVTKAITSSGYSPTITTPEDAENLFNVLTNSFSDYSDGGNILATLINIVQQAFFQGDAKAYYGDRLFTIPGLQEYYGGQQIDTKKILQRTYRGLIHSRIPGGFLNTYKETGLLQNISGNEWSANPAKKVKKTDLIKVISSSMLTKGYNSNDTSLLDYLQSKFVIDAQVQASNGNLRTNPYQKMIRNTFSFETSRTDASSVLKAVAGSFTNVYFDAKGNLIYQMFRQDDIPNGEPGIDYDEDVTQNQGYSYVYDAEAYKGIPLINPVAPTPLYQRLASGYFSQTSGLHFHGRNYLIGDESLLGWKIDSDEAPAVTYVIQPNINDLFTQDDFLKSKLSGTSARPDLLSRFGTRIAELPALITSSNSKDLNQLFAEGMLNKINASIESCSVRLNTRPDLQLGRTFLMLERRKLYYLTRIDQQLTWGQQFNTTIRGEYGHVPGEPIGDPWKVAFANKPVVPVGLDLQASLSDPMSRYLNLPLENT